VFLALHGNAVNLLYSTKDAQGTKAGAKGPDMTPLRLAVLISAGGTTLQNLIDWIAAGKLDARIVQVVSSHPEVYGLERARRAGLPTAIVTRKEAGSREEFSRQIFAHCRQAQAELVCMAGFLQLLTIPEDFHLRVLNIHPSLIPAFCGKGFYGYHVHEAVLQAGVKITGCTVHFADNEYDHGPIVVQRAVPVLDEDTPDTLADRVFREESEAYPEAIRHFAEGRLRVEGQRVRIHAPVADSDRVP
jgi:formyltetrahydrofolate-dependent phosphoribosylglycinamide formyltransferase